MHVHSHQVKRSCVLVICGDRACTEHAPRALGEKAPKERQETAGTVDQAHALPISSGKEGSWHQVVDSTNYAQQDMAFGTGFHPLTH